jgi:hypothetical protein
MAEHEQKEHGSVESLLQVGNTGASIPVDGGTNARVESRNGAVRGRLAVARFRDERVGKPNSGSDRGFAAVGDDRAGTIKFQLDWEPSLALVRHCEQER